VVVMAVVIFVVDHYLVFWVIADASRVIADTSCMVEHAVVHAARYKSRNINNPSVGPALALSLLTAPAAEELTNDKYGETQQPEAHNSGN